jgi:hypothetical protein
MTTINYNEPNLYTQRLNAEIARTKRALAFTAGSIAWAGLCLAHLLSL